ncbi:hypothetical protein C7U57_26910 [Pseudomonas sp. R9.37]|nr:hypothetical protein C7U57_26910 [Pseudomonas sp. R9.37]
MLRAELLDMALAWAGKGLLCWAGLSWRAALGWRAGLLWRAGLPRVGARSGPETRRRVIADGLRWIDWGRCAAQRGASPLATLSPPSATSRLPR